MKRSGRSAAGCTEATKAEEHDRTQVWARAFNPRTHGSAFTLLAIATALGCASVLGLPDEYSGGGGSAGSGGQVDDAGLESGVGGNLEAGYDGGDTDGPAGSGGGSGSGGGTAGSAGVGGAAGVGGTGGVGGAGGTGVGGTGGTGGVGGSAGIGGTGGSPPQGTILGITAGMRSACAIVQTANSSQVHCWGRCGALLTHDCPPNVEVVLEPQVILINAQQDALEDVKELAAGENVTCALKNDGTVWCWGNCFNGAVGNPGCTQGVTSYAMQVMTSSTTALTNIDHLGGGATTFCGFRTASGEVYCWGNDPLDPAINLYTATLGPVLPGISRIDVGGLHVCAVVAGKAVCWGANNSNQSSGVPTDAGGIVGPTEVPITDDVIDIAAGHFHSCAVREDEKVACWGAWNEGTASPAPATVLSSGSPLGAMTSISGLYWHSCGLSSSGSPHCWGNHPDLWLGNPHGPEYIEPGVVAQADTGGNPLSGMRFVSGEGIFACAASLTEVYCWGDLGYEPTVYSCKGADAGGGLGCSPEAVKIQGLP